jgi:hypothetical protein
MADCCEDKACALDALELKGSGIKGVSIEFIFEQTCHDTYAFN